MQITTLVDNHTFIDQYYLGEPALSLYIEDGQEAFLFDTGYSDIFIRNSELLNIDLTSVKQIILSHGHNDHTGGLQYIEKECALFGTPVLAHPKCFWPKRAGDLAIGSPVSQEELIEKFPVQLTREPVRLTEKLWFLGEVGDYTDFEKRVAIGETLTSDGWEPDYVSDDTALAYETKAGLFIITGCSHSGICNICEQAKKATGIQQIVGVFGGFHLFEVDERLAKTIEYFKQNNIQQLYPSHCISFQAKARINQELRINDVGVGLQIVL